MWRLVHIMIQHPWVLKMCSALSNVAFSRWRYQHVLCRNYQLESKQQKNQINSLEILIWKIFQIFPRPKVIELWAKYLGVFLKAFAEYSLCPNRWSGDFLLTLFLRAEWIRSQRWKQKYHKIRQNIGVRRHRVLTKIGWSVVYREL